MSPKTVLLLLALLTSGAYHAKVVKHYHYHFGNSLLSAPFPPGINVKLAISIYLSRYPVTDAEYKILNSYVETIKTDDVFSDTTEAGYNAAGVTFDTGQSCQEVINVIVKVVEINKQEVLNRCDYEVKEDARLYGRLLRASERKRSSN